MWKRQNVPASKATSLKTYERPRRPERLKQCAGMASRICLMVKSGISNSFPYVSSSFPGSSCASDARDDNEVVEGDCRGVSIGDAVTELVVEEFADLWRSRAMRFGRADVDMPCRFGFVGNFP